MPDEPIEFRATRSGLSITDWLAVRAKRDSLVYGGAAGLLLICAVFAFFATYLFAYLVVSGLNSAVGGPLSGWLMSSAAGVSVVWFGVLALPDLVPRDQDLFAALRGLHYVLSRLLILVIVVHLAAVVRHDTQNLRLID